MIGLTKDLELSILTYSHKKKELEKFFPRSKLHRTLIVFFTYSHKMLLNLLRKIARIEAKLKFQGKGIIPIPLTDTVKNVILYLIRAFEKRSLFSFLTVSKLEVNVIARFPILLQTSSVISEKKKFAKPR